MTFRKQFAQNCKTLTTNILFLFALLACIALFFMVLAIASTITNWVIQSSSPLIMTVGVIFLVCLLCVGGCALAAWFTSPPQKD